MGTKTCTNAGTAQGKKAVHRRETIQEKQREERWSESFLCPM